VADGELDEDELHPPPTRHCHQETPLRCHPWDDDEGDGYQKRPRARSFISRVSNRMESRSKNRDIYPSRVRDSSWYRGESSRGRVRAARSVSPPPSHISLLPDKKGL
jgi:hypothetical protein